MTEAGTGGEAVVRSARPRILSSCSNLTRSGCITPLRLPPSCPHGHASLCALARPSIPSAPASPRSGFVQQGTGDNACYRRQRFEISFFFCTINVRHVSLLTFGNYLMWTCKKCGASNANNRLWCARCDEPPDVPPTHRAATEPDHPPTSPAERSVPPADSHASITPSADILRELRLIREQCAQTKWASRLIALMIALIMLFGVTFNFR